MSTGGEILIYKASQGEFTELTNAEAMLLPVDVAFAGRTVLEKLTIASLKSQAAKRAAAYIAVLLMHGAPHVENIKAVIISWFKKVTGEVIANIDKDEILHAVGRVAAKTFAKKLRQKYHIECPITDFYSDMIAEELGDWVADVVNDKLSQAMGKQVRMFTTLFPPDNIKSEIDAFMVNEINTRLNLHITSVLNNANLAKAVKTEIVDLLQKEMTNIIIRNKGLVIDRIQSLPYSSDAQVMSLRADQITAINLVVTNLLQEFSNNAIFGFRIKAIQYYGSQKSKIANKMRQRAYRKTHKENRVWVLR